jgi:hypothetical protein
LLVIHVPVLSQVWIAAPEHWADPGTHVPSHAPFAQPNEQACDGCQVPVASQTWTPSPAHCFAPVAHAPLQTPAPVH